MTRLEMLKEIEQKIRLVEDEVEIWEKKYYEAKEEYQYKSKQLESLRKMYNDVEQLKLF